MGRVWDSYRSGFEGVDLVAVRKDSENHIKDRGYTYTRMYVDLRFKQNKLKGGFLRNEAQDDHIKDRA